MGNENVNHLQLLLLLFRIHDISINGIIFLLLFSLTTLQSIMVNQL